jgi:DNA-binding helix-hairpin-helix protein with protein kinase domain
MSTRLETLQRLMNLYAAVEQMHSTELQRLTTAVREAQQAIAVEQSAAEVARIEGRKALTEGDRVGWMMSETQQETAWWKRQKLEEIRVDRQELSDAAREQYVASRLKKEQMKRVFEEMEARVQIEEGRRMQSSSDDLFLSRRRWTDAKEKTEEREQMKAS